MVNLINFVISIIICSLISVLIIILSFWGYGYKIDFEKTSVYECGFNPFGQARTPFNIKFYLVSLLFIVFDIETLILCPFAIEHFFLEIIEEIMIFIISLFLMIGIVYEIRKDVYFV